MSKTNLAWFGAFPRSWTSQFFLTFISAWDWSFNQVCKYDFKTTYFPFFMFLCIFPFLCFLALYGSFVFFYLFVFFMIFCAFLCFLLFCGRQGCFPRSYVSSIVMRKSDLRSSFGTKCLVKLFLSFFARYILTEQKSFKAFDL